MVNINMATAAIASLIHLQLVRPLNELFTLGRIRKMSYKPMKKPGKKKPGKM
jgi:hypothetical protein